MSQSAGSKNGMAKLTEAQVAQIREALGAGEFQRVIAARFGVSQAIISQIKNGRKWRTT